MGLEMDHHHQIPSTSVGIARQSSIEMEPRTLGFNQIDFAREAALYVVNTHSIEEALRIFTQGLEPVSRCAQVDKKNKSSICLTAAEEEEEEQDHSASTRPNDRINMRDIVSAPF